MSRDLGFRIRLGVALIGALFPSAAALTGAAAPPPSVAPAIAAYDRGDFKTALEILKPIVYDASTDSLSAPHAWGSAYLAQMYRRGEGTLPDWPLSCALFNDAWMYGRLRGPGSVDPPIPFVADGMKEVCLPGNEEEVMALRSACFLDGVTRHEFVLDGGARVVVDRRGFHLDFAGEHRDVPLSMACHQTMVSLTEADVSIVDRASNRRVHFLELFKWTNGFDRSHSHIVRELHWTVYAVKGLDLAAASDRIVLTATDGPYPSAEMPPGVRDAAVLRLNAAGNVEWILKASPGKRPPPHRN